ncbi:FKBP-type peptidyl-prolyl cis-trans isomerase N-terminal domain-containing protein, partial [Klebsiella pneumoniae]
ALLAGLTDALEGNTPSVPVETLHNALRTMHERAEAVRQERQAALAEAGKVFLAENVKKEGVQVTESGLQYKVLKAGDGAI